MTRPHADRSVVVALHCSGADGGQWGRLAAVLERSIDVWAPDFYGCPSIGPWQGEEPFRLQDEAVRILDLIDGRDGPVHLVGHSYGGGVALAVALARPSRIASMALYEPSAFHLLPHMSADGTVAHAEIKRVAAAVTAGVSTGEIAAALSIFVDYWNGAGAWQALRPATRAALLAWAPKAPLDFAALLDETAPPAAYKRIACPVLVLRGDRSPLSTRVVADGLARLLPAARLSIVPGAGHMGPFTHAADVTSQFARLIAACDDTGASMVARRA